VPALFNLAVDLGARDRADLRFGGGQIELSEGIDERTLAWIDDEFGGAWSSEAAVGSNVVARKDGAPVGFATFDAKGLRYRWLRGAAREPGVGLFGPIGVTRAERGRGIGRRLLLAALDALRERGYARALIAAAGQEALPFYARAAGATVAETYDLAALTAPRARVVAMVSGSGTNLQAVLDASRSGELPVDVAAVISSRAEAYALERARRAGVPCAIAVQWRRDAEPRGEYDVRLHGIVRAQEPDLVLLLGWMHLLPEHFVRAFADTLNVHPAFLPLDPQRDDVTLPDGTVMPAFRGSHAVRDALASGSRWTGATVHAVTAATDRGPVLARKPLRVQPGEEEASVMERLHPVEHRLVTGAIKRWLYER
jgi:phosphoribosylglycinamide formyltransferase-1